jgi:Ca-activated chloride channel family protein
MSMHEFHFLRPLWLLALIPLMLALWRLATHGDDADSWRQLVDPHLLPHVLVGQNNNVRRLPLALLGLGWVITVLALAGPVWKQLPRPVYQATTHRVLGLDLSPSMNATDLPPSRLTHARFKVLDILKRAQEGHTALLAYGTEPYVVSPLTSDARTIEAQVPSLETELLPVEGPKNTALALRKAGELLRRAGAPTGEIILITDGLAHPAVAQQAAASLRQAGYRVSVLAVGTSEGAPIPLPDGGFLKGRNGTLLLSKLNRGVLRALAAAGGGRYVEASLDDHDVQAVMESGSPGLEAALRQSDVKADTWREEGPWLLLVLLPLAAVAFRRGWLMALVWLPLLSPAPAEAFSWSSLWLRPDQQAAQAMEQKDYSEAAKRFEHPDWRAAAEYAAGDYEQALQTLSTAGDATVHYNRGNALAQLGRLKQAMAEYNRALAANPNDEDARYNRNLVHKLLQEKQQPQPRNSQGHQQSNSQPANERKPPVEKRSQSDSHSEETSSQSSHSGDASQQGQAAPAARHQAAARSSQAAHAPQKMESAEKPQDALGSAVSGAEEPPTTSQQKRSHDQSQQPKTRPGVQAEPNFTQQDASRGHQSTHPAHEPGVADLLAGQSAASKPKGATSLEKNPDAEAHRALEQMLRQVPDDPGGLLRQRFLLQHLRRAGRLP